MNKTQKSPWQTAKDQIVEYALKDLKEHYGIEAMHNQIVPKVYRDNPDHVLLFTDEFNSDLIYIMYRKDYRGFCNEYGVESEEPLYYKIDKDKVAVTEYSKGLGASRTSWALPVQDLVKIKKKPQIAHVAEIPFEYEEDDTDQNISALTIRDFYAIVQNIPVSGKRWLNNIIVKNNGR